MEPLSITAACVSLISNIGKTSFAVTSFLRECRAARHDLDAVSRELTSLQTVVTLVKDTATSKDQEIPQTLREQIANIVSNCCQVLAELDDLLQKFNGAGVDKAARWVLTGKGDAAKLRSTLEAHIGALNLALDLLTLTVTREVKADTQELKQNTTQILAEIARLRTHLLTGESREEDKNFILDRYFDSLTSYAETVCEDWSDGNSENPLASENPNLHQASDDRLPSDPQEAISPTVTRSRMSWMMPSLDRITFFQRNEANSNPSTLDVARSKDKTLMATEISRKEDETVMPELQSSHSENETPIRPNPAEIRQDQAQDTEKHSSSTLGKERGIRRIGMKLNSLFNNKGSVHYPKILKGHRSWVMAVAFSPDGELVASGSEDGSLKLWNPTKGRCCQTLKGHYIPGPKPASFISTGIQAVAFSPGGKLVASAARDRAIELWDLAACEDRGRLLGHTDMVCAIAFSPDGKLIASGSVDRTARLWDLATCEDRWTLECKGSVLDVAFSPDGKLVASASKYGTVHLWDSATGQQSGIYKGYGCWVLSAAFSPDGKLVASALKDGSISLWNPATSVGRGTLVGHTGFVSAVAFSPDGKLLASASEDGTVRLWDPATRKSYGILKGHSGVVFAVAFSPDSTLIASASEDRTVRLWDLPTGQTEEELAPPPLPSPLSPIPP